VLLGVALSMFHVSALGQSPVSLDVKHDTPGQLIKPGQSVRMDVELRLVNITVTDPHDRIVTGLEADNFRIFEDNIEQEVVTFSSEDVPISVGIILDLSGSMANKIGKAKETALELFKTANPQDEFLLVTFSEHAQLTSRFSTNIEELGSSLLSSSAKGRTALLDAIYLGLSEMVITTADTARTISNDWFGRLIPSSMPWESLILSGIGTVPLGNSMGLLCCLN
jgi:hypothetical protein